MRIFIAIQVSDDVAPAELAMIKQDIEAELENHDSGAISRADWIDPEQYTVTVRAQ